MGFWKNSPGPHLSHYLKSIFCSNREIKLLEDSGTNREEDSSKQWTIRRAVVSDVPNIIKLWKQHFRRPNSPICLYKPDELEDQLNSDDYIVLIAICGSSNKIIGTIMSHQLGNIKRIGCSAKWSTFRVRWIDMFCVHPEYWNKGIGSGLLSQLDEEHKLIGDAACFFMKEGEPLKMMPSLRSSSYVYRIASSRSHPKVEEWTEDHFLTFVQTIREKSSCIVHNYWNRDHVKTKIFSYNGFRGRIVAAFVSSSEYDLDEEYPIVWNSGFFKHGDFMDSELNEAAIQLSDAAAAAFNSQYIWMDARHLGRKAIETGNWSYDGSYHMYTYHMDTGIYFNAEPFLIL